MASYNPAGDLEGMIARAQGMEASARFLLMTTIVRYQTQLRMLTELQEDLKDRGTFMERNGQASERRSLNPSTGEYLKLCSAANGTAKTLMAMLRMQDGQDGDDTGDNEEDDEL